MYSTHADFCMQIIVYDEINNIIITSIMGIIVSKN